MILAKADCPPSAPMRYVAFDADGDHEYVGRWCGACLEFHLTEEQEREQVEIIRKFIHRAAEIVEDTQLDGSLMDFFGNLPKDLGKET